MMCVYSSIDVCKSLYKTCVYLIFKEMYRLYVYSLFIYNIYIYIFTLPIDRRRPSPRDLLFLDGVTRNCQAEAAIADQC